jgi:hypothetical protein
MDEASSDDYSSNSDDDEGDIQIIIKMQASMKKAARKRKEKKRRNREQHVEKNKRNRGQIITDSNLQYIWMLGVNDVNMINTYNNNALAVTMGNCFLTNYIANSETRGLMDSLGDVCDFVMKITWRYKWPLFKMLDDEDYSVNSNFSKFIMKKSGRDPPTSDSKLWWGTVKPFVSNAMQNSCSLCTQSLRMNS